MTALLRWIARLDPNYNRLVADMAEVAGVAEVTGIDAPGVDELLPLALSRPGEALKRARAVLAGRPGPYQASVAHQAAGIALREFGDVRAGLREVQGALRDARRTGSPERVAEVQATLGVALVYAGRTSPGLAVLDQALLGSSGLLAARVLVRRGMMLWTVGRHAAALDDLHRAIAGLRTAGDALWLPRALNARGMVYRSMGMTARADADFVAAGLLWAKTTQVVEATFAVENRALIALWSGDLPAALSFLDEAEARYRPMEVPTTGLSIDRCVALLAAGLASDALAIATAAVDELDQIRGRSTKKTELLVTAAECALAAGQPAKALSWAQAACRMSRSQESAWWFGRASLVLVMARYAAGPASAALLRAASAAAARLADSASPEAAQAHLLAGRVAMDLGRQEVAGQHLAEAALARHRGPPLAQAAGWLSEALRAGASGDHRRQLAACRRGFEVLDQHRVTLGSSELRARATAHGSELAVIAQRHAARAGPPRSLLMWSERWRATALAVPAVRPPSDPALQSGLTALRDVVTRLESTRKAGPPDPFAARELQRLERERGRLENTIRRQVMRARGTGPGSRAAVSVAGLLAELGDDRLVEIVDVDGTLHVLICGAGRVRRMVAGRVTEASRAADLAKFALRRLARARPGDDPASAVAVLAATGARLSDQLLGQAVRYLGHGPVIVVPPGRLQAIPWALIPALSGREFTVAPSATSWLRARSIAPPSRRRVVLACGPGLATRGAEIPLVATLYGDVTVLADKETTAVGVLTALEGTWLAHLAAHGSFRADSPMFSSLRMHDGPLTVYDFEQLGRAPYRMVLPSCDSGAQAPAGADELLGLVSSLLQVGTAGVIAAIVPLNDEAVVPVMVALHRRLGSGQNLAGALSGVRREVGATDLVRRATIASLLALGAA